MPTLAERLGVAGARFASPEATVRAFLTAIQKGNLEHASECIAKRALLLTPDMTAVNGPGSIREVLAQLIAQRPRIQTDGGGTLLAGEVAYVHQHWRIAQVAAGESYTQLVAPILVLHRLEGDWKLAILAPWRPRELRGEANLEAG